MKYCIEALNQRAQPLEKKAAFTSFTRNIGNPSNKTNEIRNSWTIIVIVVTIIIIIFYPRYQGLLLLDRIAVLRT